MFLEYTFHAETGYLGQGLIGQIELVQNAGRSIDALGGELHCSFQKCFQRYIGIDHPDDVAHAFSDLLPALQFPGAFRDTFFKRLVSLHPLGSIDRDVENSDDPIIFI